VLKRRDREASGATPAAPGAGLLESNSTLEWPVCEPVEEAPAFDGLTRESISAPVAAANAHTVTTIAAVHHG